jgi:hypothetical protein
VSKSNKERFYYCAYGSSHPSAVKKVERREKHKIHWLGAPGGTNLRRYYEL